MRSLSSSAPVSLRETLGLDMSEDDPRRDRIGLMNILDILDMLIT
jgi:hypothetical protein